LLVKDVISDVRKLIMVVTTYTSCRQ